jgi:hypothetical protein
MKNNIQLEDEIAIKWRRSTTNGSEDYIIQEVGVCLDGYLKYREYNVDYLKRDDLQWKPEQSEAVRLITGMDPTDKLVTTIREELIKVETLMQYEL